MTTVDERVKGQAMKDDGGGGPARRPIPLPPASLKPPPRVRRQPPSRSSDPEASPGVPDDTAGRAGARRGFLLGLLLPALGLGIVAFLWWQNRPEGTPASDLQVRARVEQEPAGETPGTVPGAAIPVPGVAGSPSVASGGDVLSIQIASCRTRRRAEEVLAEAQARTGLKGLIIPAQVEGVRWYRILLGAFAAPEEAIGAAGPLLEDGMISEVLVRPVPERWIPALTGPEGSS